MIKFMAIILGINPVSGGIPPRDNMLIIISGDSFFWRSVFRLKVKDLFIDKQIVIMIMVYVIIYNMKVNLLFKIMSIHPM